MWGNLKGWLISAAIAVLMGVLIVVTAIPPQISSPTGKLAAANKPIALSVDPLRLIQSGDKDCDAGDLYRKVIEDWKANGVRYGMDEVGSDPKKLAANPPEIVQDIVAAADCSRDTLFSKNPAELINYGNAKALDGLDKAGDWAGTIAAYQISLKQYDAAERYLRGIFVLGYRLYNERLVDKELSIGLNLMNLASLGYVSIAKAHNDTKKVNDFASLADAIRSQLQTDQTVWEGISQISGANGDVPYPGDIFDIAEHSNCPTWRVMAILKLGLMQRMQGVSPGDQRGAVRVLKRLAGESDLPPSVHTAAVAARDMTEEQFNGYGGGG